MDGIRNPKLQSVFFEDMPVHRASFANGGAQVLLAPQFQPLSLSRRLPRSSRRVTALLVAGRKGSFMEEQQDSM